MTDNLYIPAQTPTPAPPVTPPSSETTPPVTVTTTPDGNVICFGADCYLQDTGSGGTLQELSELSCTGSICRLVGADQTYFIQKHGLTHYTMASARASPQASQPMNFGGMMSSLGSGLSAQFGTPSSSSPFILIAFALVAVIGGAFLLYFKGGSGSRKGGYD